MDIRKLQRAIVDGLEDVKAQQITVFNTEHLSALFERVIIASGTSNRQTKALAASVRDSVRANGMQVMATEGEDNGEWIIVDCGAAVAHIMQPAIREYYHLEEIWGGKSVRMKIGASDGKLVKASEPGKSSAKQGAAKRGAPQQEPARPGKPLASSSRSTRAATGTTTAASRSGSAAARPPVKTAARTAGRTAAKPVAGASPKAVKPTKAPMATSKSVVKVVGKPAGKVSGKSAGKAVRNTAAKPARKAVSPARKSAVASKPAAPKAEARKPVARKAAAATRPGARPAPRR